MKMCFNGLFGLRTKLLVSKSIPALFSNLRTAAYKRIAEEFSLCMKKKPHRSASTHSVEYLIKTRKKRKRKEK